MQEDLTQKDLQEINKPETIDDKIRELAKIEMEKFAKKVKERVIEMELDNDDHYLIYGVLGVHKEEGKLIDVYQNKGRFLYKYAGAFAEEVAKLCFIEKYGAENARTIKIDNPIKNSRPKTFEIDCLVNEKDAWSHILEKTGVDLLAILEDIYRENTELKE
ncbi:ApaLI family restriction endonuclease [Hutsoniella sourekii]|uniref:ApaLI family restriction endonuclease n=1 Tax=Hutsoniella sourekii TaxID=87650 RepID=UPI0004AFCBEE|nr:ApaLI family restriction endonuclease [Hutsoniella sourekii]